MFLYFKWFLQNFWKSQVQMNQKHMGINFLWDVQSGWKDLAKCDSLTTKNNQEYSLSHVFKFLPNSFIFKKEPCARGVS